jgi:hypothetical protein
MAINDKSRNLHQPSRLTRDLADKVRVFGLAQPFQRRALTRRSHRIDNGAALVNDPNWRGEIVVSRPVRDFIYTGRDRQLVGDCHYT